MSYITTNLSCKQYIDEDCLNAGIKINQRKLTLPMRRLLCPKHNDAKISENHLNPVMNIGIHCKVLAEYSQLSNHMSGFQHISVFLHHFVMAKLATSSIRVNFFF